MSISRRNFLRSCAGGGGALLAVGAQPWAFDPLTQWRIRWAEYPNRDWEKVYSGSIPLRQHSFTWICGAERHAHVSPAGFYVRNGVMVRSEQNYDHDRYGDLYGNQATKAWNPRGCPKGLHDAAARVWPLSLEGSRACAKGWKDWVRCRLSVALGSARNCGPSTSSTIAAATHYVRVSWDEVSSSIWPRACHAVCRDTYSGRCGGGTSAQGWL
jgi:hypothetical protein